MCLIIYYNHKMLIQYLMTLEEQNKLNSYLKNIKTRASDEVSSKQITEYCSIDWLSVVVLSSQLLRHQRDMMSPSMAGISLFFISVDIWHQTQGRQKVEHRQSLHKVPWTHRIEVNDQWMNEWTNQTGPNCEASLSDVTVLAALVISGCLKAVVLHH